MHVVVLVEEPSAEAALNELLPTIFGSEHSFEIIVHQCKHELLAKLPGKLWAYRMWVPADWRFVVLVDRDREDCRALKVRLEQIARQAGFTTRSTQVGDGSSTVLTRLAIEELEAWFIGDVPALRAAYPGVPVSLGEKARYRDPDRIVHTWEALERILQRAGYFPSGMAKIAAARKIAGQMDIERNRSRSFQVFRNGIRMMVGWVETESIPS